MRRKGYTRRRFMCHRCTMRSLFFALAILVPTAQFGGGGGAAFAQEDDFQAYLQTLGAKARAAGVRDATVASVLPTLTFSPRVVELDRAQPGGTGSSAPSAIPNFAPYRTQHVEFGTDHARPRRLCPIAAIAQPG